MFKKVWESIRWLAGLEPRKGGFGAAVHLKLNLADCDKVCLANVDDIKWFLDTMPYEIGMRLIVPSQPVWVHTDNPLHDGITGVSILAESHISIHTFPEKGFLYLDIFSCKPFDTKKAIETSRLYFCHEFDIPLAKSWITDRSDLFDYDKGQENDESSG